MPPEPRPYIVASDVGGTFTDTVVIDAEGRVTRHKSPTVPTDPAVGVLETLRTAAAEHGLSTRDFLGQVGVFSHGTTVATNAMIQGRTARVGLVQTGGFGDTLSIMRGFKSLGLDEERIKRFRDLVKQPVVVPKWLTAEVTERIDYRGRVLLALDEDDVRRAVARLVDAGAEVFAVALLWSFANDAHERRVAELIEEIVPDAEVTCSSELLPRIGEYQRTLTTAVNASLRPVLRTSLDSFERTLAAEGLAVEPFLMQSNGGLATFAGVGPRAAATVLSGPVGGVIASAHLGDQRGDRNIVTTDMGGTSFDVGIVLDGRPVMANTTQIGRDQLALPSVAVRTVGAGAGSIASAAGGVLTVGPQSAGADPGPACYGRGGTRPTVTDADLVLGYLNPGNFLGGALRLDPALARAAIEEHVAGPLGLSVEVAAEGIKTVVDARMADLIRQMTVEQGYDPDDFALYAYGGAGPTHAFSYGAELRTRTIVVPLTASVHSAYGIARSDLTVALERSRPMQSPPGSTDYAAALPPDEFAATFGELAEEATATLRAGGAPAEAITLDRYVEMRFRAQIHVLTVPVGDGEIDAAEVDAIVARFVDQYEGRFGKGSAFPEAGVEITTFRLVATGAVGRPEIAASVHSGTTAAEPRDHRDVWLDGRWVEAAVYTGIGLEPGASFDGLAIVELPDTTVVVGAGQSATVDPAGSIVVETGRGE